MNNLHNAAHQAPVNDPPSEFAKAINTVTKAIKATPKTVRDKGFAKTVAAFFKEFANKRLRYESAIITPNGLAKKLNCDPSTVKRHFGKLRNLDILPASNPTQKGDVKRPIHREPNFPALLDWLTSSDVSKDAIESVLDALHEISSAHTDADAARRAIKVGVHESSTGVGVHEEGVHENGSCAPILYENPSVNSLPIMGDDVISKAPTARGQHQTDNSESDRQPKAPTAEDEARVNQQAPTMTGNSESSPPEPTAGDEAQPSKPEPLPTTMESLRLAGLTYYQAVNLLERRDRERLLGVAA